MALRQEESRIKSDIHDALEARGAYWATVPQGTFGKPGDPDMIVCYKGRFIGMESKTPIGRLRDVQKLRRKQIEAAGGIYAVVRSVEDAMKALDDIDMEGDHGTVREEE